MGSGAGSWRFWRVGAIRRWLLGLAILVPLPTWSALTVEETTRLGEMREKLGRVTYQSVTNLAWTQAVPPQSLGWGDQLATASRSWAIVTFRDGRAHRLKELTLLRVVPGTQGTSRPVALLQRGGLYYAGHLSDPAVAIQTPHGLVRPEGTEFVIEVRADETILIMADGQAELENDAGRIRLFSGEAGVVREGQPPRPARLEALNVVQWWLYYPAVLDVTEMPFSPAEREVLADSLAAYAEGDLVGALDRFPQDAQGLRDRSVVVRTFHAALLLAVGAVEEAIRELEGIPNDDAHAASLRRLVAAVRGDGLSEFREPKGAGDWLADSYLRQARHDLEGARQAARQSVQLAPQFAFAWVRLAELEFSFGRVRAAQEAVQSSLALAPRNAQAHALQGFLWAADNRMARAQTAFEAAVQMDPGLGNGWLGLGLCKIRRGRVEEGRQDLATASLLDPNRALLHSYLGRAHDQSGEVRQAEAELQRARDLDPNDPTVWLYTALAKHQQNRPNEAVADLEQSRRRNGNRALYRSDLLLHQDAAVRSANLAHLYTGAGLEVVGAREAAASINSDYANFSGHLFLANSYSLQLDPGRVNLRYETAAYDEYLLANLLAPVGAGTLSPAISQQEYSKLLQRDGAGVVSSTEYLSRGAWSQAGVLHGTFGRTSAAVEGYYRQDNGQRANNDLELTGYAVRMKQQISGADAVFGQVLWSEGETGDRAQVYDPEDPLPRIRVTEDQEPLAVVGYHHQWAPGSHSLLLAGYVQDRLQVHNPARVSLTKTFAPDGSLLEVSGASYTQDYVSELQLLSIEGQQILQRNRHTFIGGLRGQAGDWDLSNLDAPDPANGFELGDPTRYSTLSDHFDQAFYRTSLYGYYNLEVVDNLLLSAGVGYDWMQYPANFRYAPLLDEEASVSQWSPKGGVVWRPADRVSVRGAYSRGLTGASLDQSLRLEPTQVAGINQAYRSVIPESVTGANAAEEMDVAGVGIGYDFPTRTYLDLTAHYLFSDVTREVGVYEVRLPPVPTFVDPVVFPGSQAQDLDYRETKFGVHLHQLLDDVWALGAGYRLGKADLESALEGIPDSVPGAQETSGDEQAWLHEVRLFGLFTHPSGFFARWESLYYQQSNQGYDPDLPGDEFWQHHLMGGLRLFERRAEVTLGILNLTDQDYRLNPLNLHSDLPRERTFFARLLLSF